MTDTCQCPPEAGRAFCDLPAPDTVRPVPVASYCPVCHTAGKVVQGQTVTALLAITLRAVHAGTYRFCRTQDCPVVYFAADHAQVFTVEQVREPVYQKRPDDDAVLVCSCFRHTVGDLRRGSVQAHTPILADITAGIQAGQCACDLRNPQGSCCVGNVRALIRRLTTCATPAGGA